METASARKADGGQSRARSIVDRSPLSIAQDNRSGDERTTRESFERAHNLSPLIAPSLHPENVYQDRWTMIAEGRAASDASKLSTTLVDHLTKSKSRGKVSCFSPFRGRGGVSWVSWGAEWDDSREERSGPSCRDEASFQGLRDVGGKKYKDPGRKWRNIGFHISKSSRQRECRVFDLFDDIPPPIIPAKVASHELRCPSIAR